MQAIIPMLNQSFGINLIEQVLEKYVYFISYAEIRSSLSFSWEEEFQSPRIVDLVKSATKDTQVLVVIGYSFPFFNRAVDSEIINNMENLQKVYFQSPDPHNLIERFEELREYFTNLSLIPKIEVDQFFLPNEL